MVPILFVESYPQSLYGQQQTLLGLLARCPDAGVVATIAAPREGVFLDAVRDLGFRVEVLAQPAGADRYGGAVYRDGPLRKIGAVWQVLGYVRRLRRWLQRERFGAVYCNDLRGLLTFGLAARLAGTPVLIWDKLDQPHGLLDWLQLPLASRNLIVVQPVEAKYPAWQRRLFRGRIRKVFDGVDVAAFQAAPSAGEGFTIGIAGTVTPRKGHDLLLPAVRRARAEGADVRLAVIGDALSDEDRTFCDRLMAETAAEPFVEWLGRRTDMPAEMARLDMLASPSRREGISRVCMEAMAAGKAVLGAAGTGLEDVIVEGETGFLVDPTDTAELADRILLLARDPALRARMGASGRARAAAEFDQDRQLREVLDELLSLVR